MGFLLLSDTAGVDIQQKQEDAVLHRLGCKVCPLNTQPGRMEPTGAANPLIYCIGEAPGATEIEQGQQFVGNSGRLLRQYIPAWALPKIRWNNVVRSRPPNNRTPDRIEIEACRPSVTQDIERTKPKAIFGFGNVPLNWVCGAHGVMLWRGRYMPVQVGDHVCWYFVFVHPSSILHNGRNVEEERMLKLDLEAAFERVPKLPPAEVHSLDQATSNIEIITKPGAASLRRLEVILGAAARAPMVGIDYETQGLRPYAVDARVLSAAVSTPEVTVAFPFDHPDAGWSKQHREDLQQLWRRFLSLARGVKISHNLNFELEWTGVKFGPELVRAGYWEDSATQASIIDERTGKMKPGPFALEWLVQQYFGLNIKNIYKLDRNDLASESLERVLPYNGLDARYHRLLWSKQKAELERQGLIGAYELALRRVPTVVLAQMRGVPVDQVEVERLRTRYQNKINDIEATIFRYKAVTEFQRITGRKLNPDSNPDTLELFYTQLKCKECEIFDRKSRKERLSCDAKVLTQIAKRHPVALEFVNLRHMSKMKSTYLDSMAVGSPILYPDGLLHARFNTIFAETGRLSCEDPNLQNYPKRDEDSKEVRLPIKAPAGCCIVSVDYGQIEHRVVGMFTKDPRFVKALWDNFDIHGYWAERIATDYPERIGGRKNLTDKKAMRAFRTDIKNQWTFPLIYGAQLSSVAGYLNIPERVITPHYESFWQEYETTLEWQKQQLAFYQKYGYVECLTGRRRHGPFTVNQVYNTPVQGTAAEIVLEAMSGLSETGDPELQPEIQVHDDLIFLRVPEKRLDTILEKILDIMLDVPFEWAKIVPISVEVSIGQNWMKMEEMATFYSHKWKWRHD